MLLVLASSVFILVMFCLSVGFWLAERREKDTHSVTIMGKYRAYSAEVRIPASRCLAKGRDWIIIQNPNGSRTKIKFIAEIIELKDDGDKRD